MAPPGHLPPPSRNRSPTPSQLTLLRPDLNSYELSLYAFGPMRLGRGSADPTTVERALHAAVDVGLTTVHSSSEYPTADLLQGALIRQPPAHDLEHVVKVQSPEYEEQALDRPAFVQQVDAALDALSAERIDVAQHLQRGPATAQNASDDDGDTARLPIFDQVHKPLFEVAADLREAGKIGALICFPHTMPFAHRALDVPGFDGFAHFFGPLEIEFASLFGDLAQQGRGFVAIRPLLQGLLTDPRIDRAQLPPDDPRRADRFDPWHEAPEVVRAQLDEQPFSWTRFALRFSTTPSAVTTSVVGINSLEQLATVVKAADEGPLELEQVDRIVRALAARPSIPKASLF